MEPNLVSNLLWVADSFLSHGWVVEGGGIPLTFMALYWPTITSLSLAYIDPGVG